MQFQDCDKAKWFQSYNKRHHLVSEWKVKWVETQFFVEVDYRNLKQRKVWSSHSTVWGGEMMRNLGGGQFLQSMDDWICFARRERLRRQETERKKPHLVKLLLVKWKDWQDIKWCSLFLGLKMHDSLTSIRILPPFLQGSARDRKKMYAKQMLSWLFLVGIQNSETILSRLDIIMKP